MQIITIIRIRGETEIVDIFTPESFYLYSHAKKLRIIRRIRGRQEIKSPIEETARSSVRSSLSDLSTGPSKDAPSKSTN